MENKNQPAFPLTFDAETIKRIDDGFKKDKLGKLQLEGLTKREYFAAKAMQAFIHKPLTDFSPAEAVKLSIQYADELLAQLEK